MDWPELGDQNDLDGGSITKATYYSTEDYLTNFLKENSSDIFPKSANYNFTGNTERPVIQFTGKLRYRDEQQPWRSMMINNDYGCTVENCSYWSSKEVRSLHDSMNQWTPKCHWGACSLPSDRVDKLSVQVLMSANWWCSVFKY
jgi:hypothetical protein